MVERAARGSAPVYGINTGFGKLATVRIAPGQIEELQRRLVLSHMCGVGPPLPDPMVRLVLAAQGHEPGARLFRRPPPHDRAAARAARRRRPAGDPGQGLGRRLGRPRAARPSRRRADRRGRGAPRRRASCRRPRRCPDRASSRSTLAAKEGLALMNGTQVSTALALLGLFRAQATVRRRAGRRRHERRCRARQRHAVRSRASTRCAASRARSGSRSGCSALLAGSEIRASHRDDASGSRTPTACAASRR